MSEGKENRYITTTLPYVNADPHIGFGLEVVQADTLARYWRRMGHEVFFSTGTDEHGQKIAQKADESDMSRQEYVDHYAEEFNKLKEALKLSQDNFIRTTDANHITAAQKLWKLCDVKEDIYKKKYKGLYCVGCELFIKESELVEGKCPDHPTTELQEIEEENYFFRLSNYQTYLEEYLSVEGVIVPEWRRQEALIFVKGGLEDFSISREKTRMDWGIPVPGDDEQVMYVWFDALTNYISTLGWPDDADGNFKKFWEEGETLQVAGKDQIRFQSIIWQAMLKSANLPATKQILYHGFINSDGVKMSKSIGNVISPYELVEKYGTDATRYIFLRHVHPFDDSDVTWEKMDEWYTANLVNGLGNLTARIMKMAETHLTHPFAEKDITDEDYHKIYSEHYTLPFEHYNFQEVMNVIWLEIQSIDEFITDTEPFRLVKNNSSEACILMSALRQRLWLVAKRLEPFMPGTAEIMKSAVLANKKPENLFNRLSE